jgi:hypothetical protein
VTRGSRHTAHPCGVQSDDARPDACRRCLHNETA